MAPKQQPTLSPTSLLWAHQLRREHSFLLDRMQKLEAAMDGVERSAAVAASRSKDDMQELSRQVQTLTDHARNNQAVEKVQQEVAGSLEELHAQIEAVTGKIARIDRDGELAVAERQAASEKEVALLQRVREIDSSLKGHGENLKTLGRRVDDGRIDQIAKRLDDLARYAQKQGAKTKKIEDTMAVLEDAGKEIKSSNDKVNEELRLIRTGIESGANALQQAADEDLNPTPQPQPATDKPAAARAARALNRKDSGSRDKRAVATQQARASRAQNRTAAPAADEATDKPATDRAAVAAARPARAAKRKSPTKKKQADLEMARAVRPGKNGAGEAEVPPGPTIDPESHRPVLRKGRGWVEVECTPSPEPTSPLPLPRQIRSVPRATAVARSIEKPAPKRRTIVQKDNTQAQEMLGRSKGKKRKADALADETIDVDAPRQTRPRVKQAAMPPSPKTNVRRGLTNLFSSPISSPPGSVEPKAQDDMGDHVAASPVRKKVCTKRTIVQKVDL